MANASADVSTVESAWTFLAKLHNADPRKPAILVDLDGTLALFNKRKDGKYWEVQEREDILNPGMRSPYDASVCWQTDAVNVPVLTVIHALYEMQISPVFVSGRSEDHRAPTLEWLHSLPTVGVLGKHLSEFPLYMRMSKDYRDDRIIKEEIYREKIAPVYNALFVLDDRDRVVAMWRDLGLTCLQVANGDF